MTLCEMAFASKLGLEIDLDQLGFETTSILFSSLLVTNTSKTLIFTQKKHTVSFKLAEDDTLRTYFSSARWKKTTLLFYNIHSIMVVKPSINQIYYNYQI